MNVQAFMGCVIPTYTNQGLPSSHSTAIKDVCEMNELFYTNGCKINIYVGSGNQLKIAAAEKAVKIWADRYFKECKLTAKGFDVSSGICEQPNGYEMTFQGARTRLANLRHNVSKESNALNIYVSMENGLMLETQYNLPNKATFLDKDQKSWIDRCCVVVEIAFRELQWSSQALSVGVTTPLKCVEQSKAVNWEKTAGSFIEKEFGWNAKDWHGSISGKSRQPIMEEAILLALGLQK